MAEENIYEAKANEEQRIQQEKIARRKAAFRISIIKGLIVAIPMFAALAYFIKQFDEFDKTIEKKFENATKVHYTSKKARRTRQLL